MCIALIGKYDLTRKQAATFAASLAWFLGIGTIISFNVGSNIKIFNMTIFELLEYLTTNILLPIGGIMIAIFVSWFIAKDNINSELKIKSRFLSSIWYFSARVLAPLAVIFITLNALGINTNIFVYFN